MLNCRSMWQSAVRNASIAKAQLQQHQQLHQSHQRQGTRTQTHNLTADQRKTAQLLS